jgi:hypothetical protein
MLEPRRCVGVVFFLFAIVGEALHHISTVPQNCMLGRNAASSHGL